MTRTMYDAVTASAIPATAVMVGGYCDTIKIPCWTAADWARFPNAVKVRIAKKASTNDGHVGDCETGDMTPAQLVQWVQLRRAHGADPTGYCNASTWPAVQAAFNAARVAHPHYWIAKYDNVQTLPTLNGITAIAHQYAGSATSGGSYDLSVVADYWPGVDTTPEVPEVEQSDTALDYDGKTPAKDSTGKQYTVAGGLKGTNDAVWANNTLLKQIETQVAAIQGALTADQAVVLAAIKAGPAAELTPDELTQLANTVASALPAGVVDLLGKKLSA